MAITVYPPRCEDFSTNGLGILTPLECTVEEQAAGMYELKLVHPIDNTLRWAQLTAGCIIKAPVPVRETPMYEFVEDITDGAAVTVQRRVYRVKTNGGRLHLRQKPSTSAKILAKYNQGTEVVQLADVGGGWFQVSVCKGGAKGYMYSQWLQYVRTITETISPAQVVGQRAVELTQSRDQLFRVTVVETDTEAGTVTVTAQHIFYDLRGNLVNEAYEPEKKAAATVATDVMNKLLNPTDFELHAGHLEGKITADYGFKTLVEILLDPDEGIAAQTRALVIRDNYDVFLLADEVRDMGVTVRRGKNLKGVTVTNDMTDVVTRIIPEGKTKDGDPLYLSGTRYVDSPHIDEYPTIFAQRIEYDVKVVDKDADNETTFSSTSAARTKLKELAEADFSENGVDLPTYGMEVDFVMLQEPAEYASLQAVHLYDTVTVLDELIGLKAKVRVTGYTWDALALQYEKVTLGELQDVRQTVYSYNLPNRGISGTKIANNTIESAAFRDATIEYAKISHAAIEQLTTNAVTAISARIGELVSDSISADMVKAATIEAITAYLMTLDADSIYTDELSAQLARVQTLIAGTAEFDQATVAHLVAQALNLEFGVAGEVFIKNLAVQYAQIVSASIGNLVIKAADGNYYQLTVDENGNVTATRVSVTEGEIIAGQTESGEVILETSITADSLNTGDLLATYALINKIDAARIDVDELMAREAFIDLLTTSNILGGKSLKIITQELDDTRGTLSRWFTFDNERGFIIRKPAYTDADGVEHAQSIWSTIVDEVGYHIQRSDLVDYVASFYRDRLKVKAVEIEGMLMKSDGMGGIVFIDAN